MNNQEGLSVWLRWLTYLSAICYFLLGLTMFLAPAWSASNFAWSITPFIAMTIGAWCIGNGAMTYASARDWRWPIIHPTLVYLWSFAITETIVLIVFRSKLSLNSWISWVYLAALLLGVLCALIGIIEFFIKRLASPSHGAPIQPWVRGGMIFFMIVVGILALGGLQAKTGGLSTEGGIFPEKLTLFTVRAFAVFFGSLVLAGIPLVRSRGVASLYFTARAAIFLIIPILMAAIVYLKQFDFASHPLQLGYFVAYIGTLLYTLYMLWSYRTSNPLQE